MIFPYPNHNRLFSVQMVFIFEHSERYLTRCAHSRSFDAHLVIEHIIYSEYVPTQHITKGKKPSVLQNRHLEQTNNEINMLSTGFLANTQY